MIQVHNVDGAVKGKAGCAGVGRVLRIEKVGVLCTFSAVVGIKDSNWATTLDVRVWSFLVSHSMTQLAKTKLNKDIHITAHDIPTPLMS